MGKSANAKDWKAVTMDWTALLDYDHSDIIGICLTQREVAILKALLTTAYWSTRWTNLTATPDELDDFVANMDYKLDGNDCEVTALEFRDNPLDTCEVQYSTDGGTTWATMFRKDNCRQDATADTLNQYYDDRDEVTTNNTTWNNDILNVAPDWVYVDDDSRAALCWAIDFYVDRICEFAIREIQNGNVERREENDWVDDLIDVITVGCVAGIAATAGAITLPAIAIGAIGFAVGYVINDIYDWLVGVDYSAFEDEDAKDIIKCAMFQAQEGVTPQYPAWRDSLEDYQSYGGNVETIAGLIHTSWNSEEDIYINYMILLEEINTVRDTLPVCPCPDRWTHTWNFVTHGLENWLEAVLVHPSLRRSLSTRLTLKGGLAITKSKRPRLRWMSS
jgi:hypothetical protein